MSVSNPLIKELKGWTRKLMEWSKEINDDHLDLCYFCQSLERCLEQGVLVRLNSIGLPKPPEAWYWIEEIADKSQGSFYSFCYMVEQVKQNEKLRTCVGRLRLFIRSCLVRKCLHVPVELLVRSPLLATEFYERNSILGDDILGEILLSVLLQCSRLNFNLNLKNASFLDETWHMPECISLQLVPCKTLGLSVCFIKEKALIINIDKSSVAAEDEKIEIGDVLDELNGHAITSDSKGKLRKLMKKASGQPIMLHIVKLRYKHVDEFYGPIGHLIKCSGLDYMKRLIKTDKLVKEVSTENSCIKSAHLNKSCNPGFDVKYCGSIFIGGAGDVKQIESAILNLLRSQKPMVVSVKFECLEIGIKVTRVADDMVICKQSYMEISSCGRTANIPDYFAFISGDTNCSMATKFDAYVFYHKNENEVQTILQSLGQGFQRTHFAV